MITCYHGSPKFFEKFDLSKTGDGTGIKFGFGVYLTESEATAVNYAEPREKSQPRKQVKFKNHYLYTVEIPDLTDDNHLVSAQPVHPAIIQRVEAKLGQAIPQKMTLQGKEFRKWIGMVLTGSTTRSLQSEKAASEFLDSIGVFCNVWPQHQSKPDSLKNYAIFNASKVTIKQIEHFDGILKGNRFIMVENSRKTIYIDRDNQPKQSNP